MIAELEQDKVIIKKVVAHSQSTKPRSKLW